MKVCFAISNYHLNKTGQVKVVQALREYVSKYHDTYIIPEIGVVGTYKYLKQIKPKIIHSNGYLMSAFIWFVNLFIRCEHYVLISETFDVVRDRPFYGAISLFCLRRVERVFVTSKYIQDELVKLGVASVVARIGV